MRRRGNYGKTGFNINLLLNTRYARNAFFSLHIITHRSIFIITSVTECWVAQRLFRRPERHELNTFIEAKRDTYIMDWVHMCVIPIGFASYNNFACSQG